MKFQEASEKYEDEFLKFKSVVNPRHPRPDICAFPMLHDLVPKTWDMIAGADHDVIYLDVTLDELDAVATEEQTVDLIRCGVRYSSDTDGLEMFV